MTKETLYTSQEELVNTEPVAGKANWNIHAMAGRLAQNYLMLFKEHCAMSRLS
jgi:hypothetical protein